MGKFLKPKLIVSIAILALIGTFFEKLTNAWDTITIFVNKVTYVEINDANKGCFDFLPEHTELFVWGKGENKHKSLKLHNFDFLEVEHKSGKGVWFSKKPRIIQSDMPDGTTNLCREDSDSCSLIFAESDSDTRLLKWPRAFAKPIEKDGEVSIEVRYHHCPGDTVAFMRTRPLWQRLKNWFGVH